MGEIDDPKEEDGIGWCSRGGRSVQAEEAEMKFGVEIPQTQMDTLEARAHRLTVEVDRVTGASSDRGIREVGGQLVDRILEWVEEIKDLREVGDEEVVERINSFKARLSLAETHVAAWPKPRLRREDAKKRRRKERKAA